MSNPLPAQTQWSALPAPAVPLSQAARAAAPTTLSPNSRRAYQNGLRRIEKQIRENLGLTAVAAVPMNDHTISDALSSLDEIGLSVKTLDVCVSAIRFAAKFGGPDPVGLSCELVMKAIRRRAPEPKQAVAILWEEANLMALLAGQETGPDGSLTLLGQRDAAIILVMSDALLRVSEARDLRITDVERSPDGSATLRIRRDKTSKGAFSGGRTQFLGAPTVARIDAWLGIAGLDPADQGPLFRKIYRGGHIARCAHCDRGKEGCCWHNATPHPCCRHPHGSRLCVQGDCCRHRDEPHRCCRHPHGAPNCTGNPCCRHLGGCDECRCHAGLSVNSFGKIVKRRAAAAGIEGRVSGHSLRVGSAVSLARANAGLVAIMQVGRWASSDMVARYTRREEAAKSAIARFRYGR